MTTLRYLLALLALNIGAFRVHPLRSLAAVAMMFGNNLVFYLVWVFDLNGSSYTWTSTTQNLMDGDVPT